MRVWRVGLLCVVFGAVGCVPKRETPAPSPPQQPQARPQPARPTPPPPPPPLDWRDRALTPGNWIYNAQGNTSQAMFGPAAGRALFIVRCDRANRQVSLWREGTTGGNLMTVRATNSARNMPLSVQTQAPAYVWSALPASDRFLDAIVFSRGRFVVEVPGTPMLVLPTWPEPARVLEDCRG